MIEKIFGSEDRQVVVDVLVTDGDAKFIPCLALWDTGAIATNISKELVRKLQLSPVRYVNNYINDTVHNAGIYRVNIILEDGTYFNVDAVEAELGMSDDPDVLIGMDIIRLGFFNICTYEDGFKFSFGITPKIRNE